MFVLRSWRASRRRATAGQATRARGARAATGRRTRSALARSGKVEAPRLAGDTATRGRVDADR
eukprot:2436920-Lingulodinium_polyedra.AAC.1